MNDNNIGFTHIHFSVCQNKQHKWEGKDPYYKEERNSINNKKLTKKKINKLLIVDELILRIVLVAYIYVNVFVKMFADYRTKTDNKFRNILKHTCS